MPLQGYVSRCKRDAQTIVSKDTGTPRKHIGNNVNRSFVTHYKIDGDVITVGEKCDFLLINEDTMIAYLIELKGSDLTKAVEQLLSTERVLCTLLRDYSLEYRIVASKCRTQKIRSSSFNRFKIKKGKSLKYSTNVIEENI